MVSISASVGLNGRNIIQDTLTVQNLLNKARPRDGLGPIAIDGIVGQETIGAIRTFQKPRLGFSDGRVDPGGQTLSALNQFDNGNQSNTADRVRCGSEELEGNGGSSLRGQSSFMGGVVAGLPDDRLASLGLAPVGTTVSSIDPKDDALSNVPEALVWVQAALNAIQIVSTLMRSGTKDNFDKLPSMIEFQALNTHFKLDRHPNPLKFLSDLGRNYTFIRIALVGAATNFDNDFFADDFANSDPGGFNTRNAPDKPGRMYFCFKYLKMGPLSKVATILHEAGHYIDRNIDHFASAVPFPDGRALVGTNGKTRTNNYASMTPDEAFQNAASYAGFAIHCAKRADTRPHSGQ